MISGSCGPLDGANELLPLGPCGTCGDSLLVLGLWRISVLLKGMGLLETAIASGAGKHGHSKKKKAFLEICTWEA